MPKGVPTAGKREAQFNKPFICARCGAAGMAATAKRRYCKPCKAALADEISSARKRRMAEAAGRAIGQAFVCGCGASVVRTSSSQRFCSSCREIEDRRRQREWRRERDGYSPLGGSIPCEGCGVPVLKCGGKQKYCPSCRAESQRKIDRELYRARQDRPIAIIGAEIACASCGSCFSRTGASQKFCETCQPDARNERARLTMARRRRVPKHRLNLNISSAICRSLKAGDKGGRSWQALVGFTLTDLMAHLAAQFSPGMSFDNHGEWHIDHVRPLCSFEFQTSDDPQFREAWALSNLRPLWAKDNLSKGGRWEPLAA